jgi:transcriptional regulator with XRE-family HTH domain
MNNIGKKIKTLRKEKGISGSFLAKFIGMSKGYLSEIESGKRVNLSVAMLKKISSALDIKQEYLSDEGTIINPLLSENVLIEKFKKLNLLNQNRFLQILDLWAEGQSKDE